MSSRQERPTLPPSRDELERHARDCERTPARARERLHDAVKAHPGTRAAPEAQERARENLKAALRALDSHDRETPKRQPQPEPQPLRVLRGGTP